MSIHFKLYYCFIFCYETRKKMLNADDNCCWFYGAVKLCVTFVAQQCMSVAVVASKNKKKSKIFLFSTNFKTNC